MYGSNSIYFGGKPLFRKILDTFKHRIEEIYLIGIMDIEAKEFVVNKNYLFLEFKENFIEIEAVESYGKLKLSITKSIDDKCNFIDVTEGKMKIGGFVFINPLSANKRVRVISFYNLVESYDSILTDVIQLELADNQIFIDPGFLGINIGGIEQKNYWEENLLAPVSPKITRVEID